jgi:hypothetical protein
MFRKCAISAGHIIIGNPALGVGCGSGSNLRRIEMTYSVQTINLTAEVLYDLTTTISSVHEIYNVLPDYSGADANITVTWAVVAGFWHIYLYSVDAITGVKVKIIYK